MKKSTTSPRPSPPPAAEREQAAPLSRPLKTLRGVGPERAAQLARLDLHTVEDLLLHRPRRYEDRRHFRTIAEMQTGRTGAPRAGTSSRSV